MSQFIFRSDNMSPLILIRRIAVSALLAATALGNAKAEEIVLGDSIGVGVSAAAGLPRLAKVSVAIRSAQAIEQIQQTPIGSTAYLSLGTNDALGPLKSLRGKIKRILSVARDRQLHLVWIGPPCVRKDWNASVQQLDAFLRAEVAGSATYVSLADSRFCDPSIKAGDGIHFTMRGYKMAWAKARQASPGDIDMSATGSIRKSANANRLRAEPSADE